MSKCTLIPLYEDLGNYNVESELPTMPRVGDHIELRDPIADDGTAMVFLVVAVAFSNSAPKSADVYLRPSGSLNAMIKKWRSINL